MQIWDSKARDKEYSSKRKIYNQISSYNAQFPDSIFHCAPVMREFNFKRLVQTDVLNHIYSQSSSSQVRDVSLTYIISPPISKMGKLENSITEENLGTCTLIAYNLVLVARHAFEDHNIRNLNVTFGYTEFNGSFYNHGHTSFDRIIEEDAFYDYAIIQLKESLGSRLGFVSFV